MDIAPSIFAADLARISDALEQCVSGGARLVHVDVMDGHFVPNLTFGPPVISAMKSASDLQLDLHLMVEAPDVLLDRYLEIGPKWLSIHWEATRHLDGTVRRIRDAGVGAGVALNPATPVSVLDDVLPLLDFVLVMSVNPGFSGQSFLEHSLSKVESLRKCITSRGLETRIELDGGVDGANLDRVRAAGVDVAVVGSGVFGAADPVQRLRELVGRAA